MVGLEVVNLHVRVSGREVVRGVSFSVPQGSVVAMMGPNGSGKSTLALSLAGHPRYEVVEGKILLNGEDVTALKPEERARRGLFLGFQAPPALEGVSVRALLSAVLPAQGLEYSEDQVVRALGKMALPPSYLERQVNVGFSGGERKRLEVAQALVLKPRVVVLDEPDSGLDVDGVRLLAVALGELAGSGTGVLLITHNPMTVEIVRPQKVLVLVSGLIAAEGGVELARTISEKGYPGAA
ncbi:MAG: Fe-S cluster assembly ATPase SufC [Thermofilum sp.]